MSNQRVVIITGMSGSGKSCAARALEDSGFFVVDNIPLPLLPQCLGLTGAANPDSVGVAVVVDVRSREFLAEVRSVLETLQSAGYQLEILFFEASDEVLARRYSETRRRHPLSRNEQVAGGIEQERELLRELKELATHFVDSSWLTPHQLRDQVVNLVCADEQQAELSLLLQSFGFRFGVPRESDLVFDVRFLPNPHFVPHLQQLTGEDPAVQSFSLDNPVGKPFLEKLQDMLTFLIPQYRKEGKCFLTVSIGCTGGRHRSVSVVETLHRQLSSEGLHIDVIHRDVAKR